MSINLMVSKTLITKAKIYRVDFVDVEGMPIGAK